MNNFLFKCLFIPLTILLCLPTTLAAQDAWLNYQQEGLAGYYPEKKDLTTNGEPFRDDLLEGAHARLPYGALVQITHLKNKKTVLIRINDRVYKTGYVIGLTKAAAAALQMTENSTAEIHIKVLALDKKREGIEKEKEGYLKNLHKEIENEIEKMADSLLALEKENLPKAAPSVKNEDDIDKKITSKAGTYDRKGNLKKITGFGVQIGNFNTIESVWKRIAEFEQKKVSEEIYILSIVVQNKRFYRVLVGNSKEKKACYPLLNKITKAGFKDAFVQKY